MDEACEACEICGCWTLCPLCDGCLASLADDKSYEPAEKWMPSREEWGGDPETPW